MHWEWRKYVKDFWMRNIHMCVSHIIIFHGMFILFSHIFLPSSVAVATVIHFFLLLLFWYVCSISFYRQLNPFSVASQMRTMWFMIFFHWIELLWISRNGESWCMCGYAWCCASLTRSLAHKHIAICCKFCFFPLACQLFSHTINAVCWCKANQSIQFKCALGRTSILLSSTYSLFKYLYCSISSIYALFVLLRVCSRIFIQVSGSDQVTAHQLHQQN